MKPPFKRKGLSGLFRRFGPLAAQKQTHRESYVAPYRRGIWAFPYPYFDMWFASHNFNKYMAKKFDRINESKPEFELFESCDEWIRACDIHEAEQLALEEEYKEKVAKIYRQLMKTFWYKGRVYGRIAPRGCGGKNGWYCYESVPEFFKEARKHLVSYWGGGERKFVAGRGLSMDHLEVFLPI